MKKLILMFLLLGMSFASIGIDSYIDDVGNAYKEYGIEETIENDNYKFMLVFGECNGYSSFGLFYQDFSAKRYELKLYDAKGYEYNLKEDDNGNVYIVSIRYKQEMNVKIIDTKGSIVAYEKTINSAKMSANVVGNNKGTDFFKLHRKIGVSFYLSIYVALISIIWVLSFAYVLKSRANAQNKLIELLEKEEAERHTINVSLDEKKEEPVYTSIEKEVESHNEQEEVDLSIYDIPADYSHLSTDQKNSVMVKLMTLKAKGIITNETYEAETVKLWKK